ncbi:MAG: hypothetical protein LBV45_08200 [Xanthomonadaceae bacterium]|nr:hypothetical protein [Xanthomonadaceae bacterium]
MLPALASTSMALGYHAFTAIRTKMRIVRTENFTRRQNRHTRRIIAR